MLSEFSSASAFPLRAVLMHSGGHYFVFVRNDERWLSISDTAVALAQLQEVVTLRPSGRRRRLFSADCR
jgi:hypothetical protein